MTTEQQQQTTSNIQPFEQIFFCTFGHGHDGRHYSYVEVEAPDSAIAHEAMYAIFGSRWAFCYDRKAFQGQPEEWGLKSIGVVYFTGDAGWQYDPAKKGSYRAS